MILRNLIIGLFIGIIASFLGCFFFITLVMKLDFIYGLNTMKSQGYLGKIITLGAILNLLVFSLLMKYNKELMARGVILATIILTIITLLV